MGRPLGDHLSGRGPDRHHPAPGDLRRLVRPLDHGRRWDGLGLDPGQDSPRAPQRPTRAALWADRGQPVGRSLCGHLSARGPALDQHRRLPCAAFGIRQAGGDPAAGRRALAISHRAARGSGQADSPDRPALDSRVHPARPRHLPGVWHPLAGDAVLGWDAPELAGAAALAPDHGDPGGQRALGPGRLDPPDGLSGLAIAALEASSRGRGGGDPGAVCPDHPLPLDAWLEGVPARSAAGVSRSRHGPAGGRLSPDAKQDRHWLRPTFRHGPAPWPPHKTAIHP